MLASSHHAKGTDKVAFVLPYPELDELPRFYQAQTHRRHAPVLPGARLPYRRLRESRQQSQGNPSHDNSDGHKAVREEDFHNAFIGRRHLLSIDDHPSGAGALRFAQGTNDQFFIVSVFSLLTLFDVAPHRPTITKYEFRNRQLTADRKRCKQGAVSSRRET